MNTRFITYLLWRTLLTCVMLLLAVREKPYAQTRSDQVYIFGDFSAGAGSPHHAATTLRVLFRGRHEVSVGYRHYFKRAPGAPLISGLLGSSYPQEYLQGLTAGYNYILYPKGQAADLLRFPLGVEILAGEYLYPANYHKTNYMFGPNIKYDVLSEKGYAVALRGGATFTPGQIFGLNLGGFLLVGKITGVGLYTGMDLGYISSRKGGKRKSKQAVQ